MVPTSAWALPAFGVAMLVLQLAATAAQVADALHPNLVLTLAESLVDLGAVLLLLRGAPVSGGLVLTIAVMLRLTVLCFVWLVSFLWIAPTLPVLWLSAASPLLYWADARTVPWMSDVLYGGVLVLMLATLLLRSSPFPSRSA